MVIIVKDSRLSVDEQPEGDNITYIVVSFIDLCFSGSVLFNPNITITFFPSSQSCSVFFFCWSSFWRASRAWTTYHKHT